MTQTFDLELTADHIRILASLTYDGIPRGWINGRWCCPFCLALNAKARSQCCCGISRDTTFVEDWIDDRAEDDFADLAIAGTWIATAAAGPGLSHHRQPPPSAL
jgi:hypothetical protein